MCGVFFVERSDGMALRTESVAVAVRQISSRGPDWLVDKWSNDGSRYIANAVLAVSLGDDEGYEYFPSSEGFGFAGCLRGESCELINPELLLREGSKLPGSYFLMGGGERAHHG